MLIGAIPPRMLGTTTATQVLSEVVADALLQHGAEVLQRAKEAFSKSGVRLAGKVAGIHWWYKSDHHAAELTSGYYNANGIDAYGSIAAIFAAAGAGVDFTWEMADSESADCASGLRPGGAREAGDGNCRSRHRPGWRKCFAQR